MTASAPPCIVVQPLAVGDLPLIARWLAAPHVREWWESDPAEALERIRETLDGRDSSRPFLIIVDDRPVGYIQAWRPANYARGEWLEDEPWLALLPMDCLGVDLFIGEENALGTGSAALRHFARMLVAEGNATIIIDPDPANARAIRAYQKAGFRPVPELLGRTEGVLLMQFCPEQANASP